MLQHWMGPVLHLPVGPPVGAGVPVIVMVFVGFAFAALLAAGVAAARTARVRTETRAAVRANIVVSWMLGKRDGEFCESRESREE